MSFLDKLPGDPHKRTIGKIQPIVDQINELEQKFEKLSDIQKSARAKNSAKDSKTRS